MDEITIIQNNSFSIPILNLAGTATDIDFRKGFKNWHLARHLCCIAHREPGIGIIGSGFVRLPIDAFKGVSAGFQ